MGCGLALGEEVEAAARKRWKAGRVWTMGRGACWKGMRGGRMPGGCGLGGEEWEWKHRRSCTVCLD